MYGSDSDPEELQEPISVAEVADFRIVKPTENCWRDLARKDVGVLNGSDDHAVRQNDDCAARRGENHAVWRNDDCAAR